MEQKFINLKQEIDNYYNAAQKNISKEIELSVNYNFKFIEENDGSHIVEIYEKDKLKLRGEYSVVGIYNIPLSVWYWSWDIAYIDKKLIVDQKNLKLFLETLEKQYSKFNQKDAEDYYYLLSNSHFYISHKNINKIIKLVLYLNKGIWILPVKHKQKNINIEDKFEFILLTKILQYN